MRRIISDQHTCAQCGAPFHATRRYTGQVCPQCSWNSPAAVVHATTLRDLFPGQTVRVTILNPPILPIEDRDLEAAFRAGAAHTGIVGETEETDGGPLEVEIITEAGQSVIVNSDQHLYIERLG